MTFANQQSDLHISHDIKKLSDLEAKYQALQKEYNSLRFASSKHTTISSSENNPSSPATPRYACPTVPPRGKVKGESQAPAVTKKDKIKRAVVDGKHRSKGGISTPVGRNDNNESSWFCTHHYMRATGASRERQNQISMENEIRAQKATTQVRRKPAPIKQESDDSTWGSGWVSTCISPYDSLWDDAVTVHEEPQLIPPPSPPLTPSLSGEEIQEEPENNRLQLPFLEDLKVGISTIKTASEPNLSRLERAHRIAKESVWAALTSGRLVDRVPDFLKDGPHLIALGFLELQAWLGNGSRPSMAQNGYNAVTVYRSIFDLTPLRNTVCHPGYDELRDPFLVDDRLQRALRAAIVLGNEEGAQEVRTLRDAVHADAQAAFQWVVARPGGQVEWKLQLHQEDMFRGILRSWEFLKAEDREGLQGVHALAFAWLNWMKQNDCLSSDDEYLYNRREDTQ